MSAKDTHAKACKGRGAKPHTPPEERGDGGDEGERTARTACGAEAELWPKKHNSLT